MQQFSICLFLERTLSKQDTNGFSGWLRLKNALGQAPEIEGWLSAAWNS